VPKDKTNPTLNFKQAFENRAENTGRMTFVLPEMQILRPQKKIAGFPSFRDDRDHPGKAD